MSASREGDAQPRPHWDIGDFYRQALEVSGSVPYYLRYHPKRYDLVGCRIEELTGIPPEEFTHEAWESIVQEVRLLGDLEGLDLEEAAARCQGPEGATWKAEYRIRTPRGEEKWLSNAAIQVRDADGNVIGSLGVLHDITQAHKAKQALQQNERYYREILDGLAEDVLVIDRDYRITDLNKGYMISTGLAREDILGKHCYEVSHGYNVPCDHKGEECPLRRVFETGKPANCHHEHLRADGSKVHVDLLLSPLLDEAGKVVKVIEAVRDVTDLYEAQIECRRQQELYRDAITVAGAVPYYQDYTTGSYPFVGEGIRELIGCSPEEFGEVWESLIQEVKLTGNLEGLTDEEAVQKCRDEGIRWTSEFRIRNLRGEDRWIANAAVPVRDKNGEVVGSLGILQDITERNTLIESLRASEERFRTMYENAMEGIAMVDAEETYIWANPAHCRQLGLGPGELVGRSLREFVDDETWELLRNETKKRRQGMTSRYTLKMKRADGEDRIFWISAIPVFDSNNRYLGCQGILLDVTDTIRAERENKILRSAVERTPDHVVVTDRDGNIEYVNPAFEKASGYTREELVGQNPRILKSGVHDEDYYRNLWETITAGKIWRGEFTNKKKDGSLYTVESIITPIRDESGNIAHFVGTMRDVTRERLLEDELRQAQKLEVVGRLAGGVAHDFNNILQAMFGFIEFASERVAADPVVSNLISEIRRGAERASSLTRQLLAFGRRQILTPRDINLNDLIKNLLKMIRRLIGEDIELDFIPGHNLGTVHADPGQMEQVVFNLCVNARDAMPNGGRLTIETENVLINGAYISTHPWAKPGHYVLLTVSDTGSGMDEKTLEKIFEPFFTTKGVNEGTGLGLSMVHGIVNQHGGMIRAYSEPDKGSVFKVYLPVVERRAVDVPTQAPPPPKGGNETILVAEDDEMVRKIVQRLLEGSGYKVLLATDGEEAVRVFEEHRDEIALVFLDVVMPKIDGRTAYEQMKKYNPELKALFSSGYSSNAIHTREILEKGLDLIQKPYDPDALRRRVREVLDRS